MTIASSVQCVIVHHQSPTTVPGVVQRVIASGVLADHIIVVDNSPPSSRPLALMHGVRVARIDNRGYAAAANYGVRLLNGSLDCRPLTIVCSHEAKITPDSLAKLVSAMDSDPQIAAAGPTLLIDGTDSVWSTGGYFSRILHRADHLRERVQESEPQDRDWLDGAFVLYRSALLTKFPFDESYFLYFEETDLHLRLSRAGHRIVWVPHAISAQQSSGIPPRLLARNTLLFQERHFSRWTGRAAIVLAAGRALSKKLLTGKGRWEDSKQILSGWRAAEKELRARRT